MPSVPVKSNQGLISLHAWLAHVGRIQVAGLCVPLSFETSTAGDRQAEQRHLVDTLLHAACCDLSHRCRRGAVWDRRARNKKSNL